MDCSLPNSSVHEIFPAKSLGEGSHFLLQGINPTRGLKLCLLHWQAGSLPLNTLGSPGWGYHLLNLKRTSPSYLHPLKYCLKIGDRTFFRFSRSVVSDSLWPHEPQHARPPCPSPTPRIYPNSRPLSWWCHPTISSSVVPFSSCPQSLPALGSFPMSQLFAWGGQSIGVSASTSVLPDLL